MRQGAYKIHQIFPQTRQNFSIDLSQNCKRMILWGDNIYPKTSFWVNPHGLQWDLLRISIRVSPWIFIQDEERWYRKLFDAIHGILQRRYFVVFFFVILPFGIYHEIVCIFNLPFMSDKCDFNAILFLCIYAIVVGGMEVCEEEKKGDHENLLGSFPFTNGTKSKDDLVQVELVHIYDLCRNMDKIDIWIKVFEIFLTKIPV